MKNIFRVRFSIGILALLMTIACASQPGATVVPTPEPGFTSTIAPSRTAIPSATPPSNAFKIVGYLAGWNVYGSCNYRIADIPADRLTHLNYAFGDVSAANVFQSSRFDV